MQNTPSLSNLSPLSLGSDYLQLITSFLPIEEVVRCRHVNRSLKNAIDESSEYQNHVKISKSLSQQLRVLVCQQINSANLWAVNRTNIEGTFNLLQKSGEQMEFTLPLMKISKFDNSKATYRIEFINSDNPESVSGLIRLTVQASYTPPKPLVWVEKAYSLLDSFEPHSANRFYPILNSFYRPTWRIATKAAFAIHNIYPRIDILTNFKVSIGTNPYNRDWERPCLFENKQIQSCCLLALKSLQRDLNSHISDQKVSESICQVPDFANEKARILNDQIANVKTRLWAMDIKFRNLNDRVRGEKANKMDPHRVYLYSAQAVEDLQKVDELLTQFSVNWKGQISLEEEERMTAILSKAEKLLDTIAPEPEQNRLINGSVE